MANGKSEEQRKADEALRSAALGFDASGDTLEGFEKIGGADTLAVPLIKILQKGSLQLDKEKPEFIQGAEVGQYFNTLTKTLYGKTIECIVLKFDRVFIEWRPKLGGFCGYHSPENAERLAVDKTFSKWRTKDGNFLKENFVYFVVIAGHEKDGVAVFSLASTSIKMAKEWNRLMTTNVLENGVKALPYYLVWELGTEYKANDQGNWYSATVRFSRFINPDQLAIAREERKLLPARQVDYKQLESGQEEGASETGF